MNLKIEQLKTLTKSTTFWASLLAVVATFTVFVTFLQGSRNPLKAIGVDIPEPRVVFWAALAFVTVIVIRLMGLKFYRRLRLGKALTTILVLPMGLVVVRLIYKVTSQGDPTEVAELIALLVLLVAAALLGPMSSPERMRLFWAALILLFTCFLILSFVGGPKGPDQYFDAISVGRIMFARYMAIGAVVTIYSSFRYGKRWLLILGFGFVLGTFLAGSRGEVVALIVVAIVSFVMMKKRLQLLAFAGASTAVLAFFTFGPWPLQVLRIRYIDLSPTYTAGRDEIWSGKVNTLEANPGQLWSGVSAADSSNSHNILLDTLLNGGIVSVALTVAIVVLWFVLVWRNRRNLGETTLSVLLVILILVGSQFSGTFFENALLWFFFTLTVLQIGVARQGEVLKITKLAQ